MANQGKVTVEESTGGSKWIYYWDSDYTAPVKTVFIPALPVKIDTAHRQTSETVVIVTLAAAVSYEIIGDKTITVTMPTTALT